MSNKGIKGKFSNWLTNEDIIKKLLCLIEDCDPKGKHPLVDQIYYENVLPSLFYSKICNRSSGVFPQALIQNPESSMQVQNIFQKVFLYHKMKE